MAGGEGRGEEWRGELSWTRSRPISTRSSCPDQSAESPPGCVDKLRWKHNICLYWCVLMSIHVNRKQRAVNFGRREPLDKWANGRFWARSNASLVKRQAERPTRHQQPWPWSLNASEKITNARLRGCPMSKLYTFVKQPCLVTGRFTGRPVGLLPRPTYRPVTQPARWLWHEYIEGL